jgi:hypothetical protein
MSTATTPAQTYNGAPLPADRTAEQWRERLGEFEQACEQAETQLTIAKANAKEAKEEFDGAVAILRAALREFTHGTTESRPLLDLAEQEPELCGALSMMGTLCILLAGHEGDHQDAPTVVGGKNTLVAHWPQTVVEQAQATMNELAEPWPETKPKRRRKAPPGVEEETLANA